MHTIIRREEGQAAVELVAVIPAVLLVGSLLLQLALAGYTAWACANAARVAARAEAVGRDAEAAARSALPRRLERGLTVRAEGGRVSVRLPVPLLVPGRHRVMVGATSRLQGTP